MLLNFLVTAQVLDCADELRRIGCALYPVCPEGAGIRHATTYPKKWK